MHSVREAMQSVLSCFVRRLVWLWEAAVPSLVWRSTSTNLRHSEKRANETAMDIPAEAKQPRTSYGSYGGGSLQPSVWSYYILTDGKE